MTSAVVIDEWALVRVGASAELAMAGVETAASVVTAAEGMLAVGRADPRLVVIGSCPDMSLLAAVRRARAHPTVATIALVGSTSQRSLFELCSAGAHAVVVRSSSEPRTIVNAARAALAGDRYLAPELVGSLFAAPSDVRVGAAVPVPLTARERSVLAELAAGRTNHEIATALCIGLETVKTHLGNIYAKLAVKRREEAVSIALQSGLV